MGNKINRGSAEFTFVTVELDCRDCGWRIGSVWRDAGQHPRAGTDHVEKRAGELVDRPDGGWTLHSRCRCGATPQTRWETISRALDGLSVDAEQSTILRV